MFSNKSILYKVVLFLLATGSLLQATNQTSYTEQYNINIAQQEHYKSIKLAVNGKDDEEYNHLKDPNHKHDKNRYILTTMGVSLGAMVVGAGVLYALPEEFTNWSKSELSEDLKNLPSKWKENVSEGPVWDQDDLFLNYVTHPYWGAVYYMQARNGGYGPFGSFMFSAIMSTFFWEYGIEAFAETPSIQDLIITPVAGSLIGELFYIQSNKIKANNYMVLDSKFLGYTSLILMDPGFAIIELTALHDFVVEQEEPYTSITPTVGGMAFNLNLKLNNRNYYSRGI